MLLEVYRSFKEHEKIIVGSSLTVTRSHRFSNAHVQSDSMIIFAHGSRDTAIEFSDVYTRGVCLGPGYPRDPGPGDEHPNYVRLLPTNCRTQRRYLNFNPPLVVP
ncbi:hypothetical protein EVAR_28057_1 [Eumeta japonica]|uniref:Uncharacterized protein n=1 Tax=Eumeta variegata TaxID=151549 RepID=A0A4C1W581_EUMVA|nr:hypothetical protein EVAR_28057_1 [Eumeta japonica]